jgi:hypothetical protein
MMISDIFAVTGSNKKCDAWDLVAYAQDSSITLCDQVTNVHYLDCALVSCCAKGHKLFIVNLLGEHMHSSLF